MICVIIRIKLTIVRIRKPGHGGSVHSLNFILLVRTVSLRDLTEIVLHFLYLVFWNFIAVVVWAAEVNDLGN